MARKEWAYALKSGELPNEGALPLWHASCMPEERSTNLPKGGNTMAKKVVAKAAKKATKKAAKPAAKKTK